MFWNKNDHKKYDFILVLYLFRDILALLNQKKVITLGYQVQASFISKKDKYLYLQTARYSFLNATQNFEIFDFHIEAIITL